MTRLSSQSRSWKNCYRSTKSFSRELKQAGADSVQIDEPVLVFDLESTVKLSFKPVYEKFASLGDSIPKLVGPRHTLVMLFTTLMQSRRSKTSLACTSILCVALSSLKPLLAPLAQSKPSLLVSLTGGTSGRRTSISHLNIIEKAVKVNWQRSRHRCYFQLFAPHTTYSC